MKLAVIAVMFVVKLAVAAELVFVSVVDLLVVAELFVAVEMTVQKQNVAEEQIDGVVVHLAVRVVVVVGGFLDAVGVNFVAE